MAGLKHSPAEPIVTEQDTKNVEQSVVAETRKAWVAPEMTLLPVEEAATQGNTGNDGSGSTTHS